MAQGFGAPLASPSSRSSTDHSAGFLHLTHGQRAVFAFTKERGQRGATRTQRGTAELSEAGAITSEEEHPLPGRSCAVAKSLHGHRAGRPRLLPALSLSGTPFSGVFFLGFCSANLMSLATYTISLCACSRLHPPPPLTPNPVDTIRRLEKQPYKTTRLLCLCIGKV